MFLEAGISFYSKNFPLRQLWTGFGFGCLFSRSLLGSVLAFRDGTLIELNRFFLALGLVGLV